MAIVINGNGIDMCNKPVSNVLNAGNTDVVNKAYVDALTGNTTVI